MVLVESALTQVQPCGGGPGWAPTAPCVEIWSVAGLLHGLRVFLGVQGPLRKVEED